MNFLNNHPDPVQSLFVSIENIAYIYPTSSYFNQDLKSAKILTLYRKNFKNKNIYSCYTQTKNLILSSFQELDKCFENTNYDFFKFKLLQLFRELLVSCIVYSEQKMFYYTQLIFDNIYKHIDILKNLFDNYYSLYGDRNNYADCSNILININNIYDNINNECDFETYIVSPEYYSPLLD